MITFCFYNYLQIYLIRNYFLKFKNIDLYKLNYRIGAHVVLTDLKNSISINKIGFIRKHLKVKNFLPETLKLFENFTIIRKSIN